MVSLAGQNTAARTDALVESVDIFATVVNAAGFEPPPLCKSPSDPTPLCVEGISALPLWPNVAATPARSLAATGDGAAGRALSSEAAGLRSAPVWKNASFTQYPRPTNGFTSLTDGSPPFELNNTNGEAVMGYSIRTDIWRYTEWVAFDHVKGVPDWARGPLWGIELYDHSSAGESAQRSTAPNVLGDTGGSVRGTGAPSGVAWIR